MSAGLKEAIALFSRRRSDRPRRETGALSGLVLRALPPRRPPQTPLESRALSRLHQSGQESLSRLAVELAREVYAEELRGGGWVLDIGLYGPELFLDEVLAELRAADGILWEIVPAHKREHSAGAAAADAEGRGNSRL